MKLTSLACTPDSDVSHNARIRKKLLIANGDIRHLTNFSRAVFPPGEIANGHRHRDMTEVFFVESGAGAMAVNQQVIAMLPGTCITIEPGDYHELRNTGSTELVVLYFGVITGVPE